MTVIRVTPALSTKIRNEALQGKNPIITFSSSDSFAKDTLPVALEILVPAQTPKLQANIATSRMRLAQNSPVTIWRLATSMANA